MGKPASFSTKLEIPPDNWGGHQWIVSRRKKTDVSSNVRLLEIPKKIIEKYPGEIAV